jgi:hypothetical protein
MVVQRFEPMTKNFATFDCDAHVAEPPRLWERAKDSLTRRSTASPPNLFSDKDLANFCGFTPVFLRCLQLTPSGKIIPTGFVRPKHELRSGSP